jgi:glutamate synthase domain-containing protein 2
MLPPRYHDPLQTVIDILLLGLLVGLFVLSVTAFGLWFQDRYLQKKHAVRRNYPLIGRFRYFFEHLGEFFRQYFFADDREELPFNRAQRSWVYRAAKDQDNTVPFGSTKNTWTPGEIIFANSAWSVMEQDSVESSPMLIGPYCREPFNAPSVYNASGMSYGAISRPAVRALSRGAARAGCWMNTGEGGLAPYHEEGDCDLVFQIGTARYGVRDAEGNLSDEKLAEVGGHEQVRMFEIKLSQGAKPGKGGLLPAEKVTPEIARIRNIPEGEASVSPNRHPDVSNEEELLDLINRVRSVTGKPAGIKAVFGDWEWLEQLLLAVHRRGAESAPDFITVDSADGGSGAAPMPLMDDVGLNLAESLPLVVDLLEGYGLRERVRVIASGKLLTPNRVAWALAMGADFCTSARGFMFALGCIQALRCNQNTCPTGVTTHDPRLQRGLVPEDKAERVRHFHEHLVREVGMIAHSCGVNEPRELRRKHARMMTGDGRSVRLDQLWPPVAPNTYLDYGRRSDLEPAIRMPMHV